MEQARKPGADDYLLKPSNPAELVEVVKAIHGRWLISLAMAGAR